MKNLDIWDNVIEPIFIENKALFMAHDAYLINVHNVEQW
jgi:hypothetical protein